MTTCVVVDGGASGCRLRGYDELGQITGEAEAGPASLSLGTDQAWQHIRSGLVKLATDCGLSTDWMPQTLALGLAGALQQDRRRALHALIPATTRTLLITDGQAQLIGAAGGKPGACLAVGTGSVLHWLDHQGQHGMAGGWGFPTGDEGSGSWLGRQLLSHHVRERDGLTIQSLSDSLTRQLTQKVGETVSEIQLWTTAKEPASYASLVPLLQTAAESGDKVANDILDDGASHCLQLLSAAPADVPVYVVGGLAPVYQSRFEKAFAERLQTPVGDALSGLYHILQSDNIDTLSC